MIKTDKYVKLPNTTMYFPKVHATVDEITNAYSNGHVTPLFLRTVVINQDDVESVLKTQKSQRPKTTEGYNIIKDTWSNRTQELKRDVYLFSTGDLDLIDFVFKYGLPYKQVRKFFKELLPDLDVDSLWKKHKKYVTKRTSKQVYGVDHPSQVEEIKQKVAQTTLERHGVTNAMFSDTLKSKYNQTMMDKHGVSHNFKLTDAVKSWQTRLFSHLTSDKTWLEILKIIANEHNTELSETMFQTTLPILRRNFENTSSDLSALTTLFTAWKTHTGQPLKYPDNILFRMDFGITTTWLKHFMDLDLLYANSEYLSTHSSQHENRVEELLKSLNISYQKNNRTILNGQELDFYIEEKSLAIEINPNQSHNSNKYATQASRSMFNLTKESTYHFNKYQACEGQGITLLQLFSYDLDPITFENKTKHHLTALLTGYTERIYARNIEIKHVKATQDARLFLNTYHTQGASKASEYYELRYQNRLVGVASFTKRHNGTIELKRMCFAPYIQIVGGVSKIIKTYFKDHPELDELYSFSDNNYGNGQGYASAGAEFVHETGPSLVFVSPTDPQDRYSWQVATSWSMKQGIIHDDLNNTGQTDNAEEYVELYLSHRTDNKTGYDRIYTAGSKLWKFTRDA